MTHRETAPPTAVDFNNENANTSTNPSFDSVLRARLSRRGLLRGSVGGVGTALLGGFGVSACGGSSDPVVEPPAAAQLLGFAAVGKSLADSVSVPVGYTASVLYALGDPVLPGTSAYQNDGSDGDFDRRGGDHHDGMEWFGLGAGGQRNDNATERGLLAINHEATTDEKLSSFFIHANGGTATLPRPAAEIDKEVALHGIAVIEVTRRKDGWGYHPDSQHNFRLTPLSPMELSGPARGSVQLATKYDPSGTRTRGTLNNCGTGKTPWGTFLTGEENWFGYFTRAATDDAVRADQSVVALKRYGRNQGAASRHGWETGGSEDKYQRWDISQRGTSANGSDDYRNEMNAMGYIVEIDAYDKNRLPKKRTGLGRFAHESAAFGPVVVGQPLTVYMGDDSRGEYIYKFVSSARWRAQDASAADRLAVGDRYLDAGTLYAARFNADADGTGQWLELSLSQPAVAGYAGYRFADAADVAIHTRLAADAVGATKMDRPEWNAVNPANGEIYFTLTNNSNRSLNPTASQYLPDAANPRAYTDMKGETKQNGNPNGHLVRLKDHGSSFQWDVYLFGAEAGADQGLVNLSALTHDQDFSSPDGLVFSKATGICWIQTDDGAYTDVSNCMMLAALPGRVGDGGARTLSHRRADGSQLDVLTQIGKPATPDTLKRFLVGPKGSEITGLAETPDGKAIFVNIQHPGESTRMADIANPSQYQSQWPANAGYGAGQRPRSATIVITKDDGGKVGT